MMPLTLAPTTEIDSLPARLGRLRMRFRTILLVREGSRIGLLALFLIIAFGWLDWRYSVAQEVVQQILRDLRQKNYGFRTLIYEVTEFLNK